ncbi:MAG TPA: hypothetical protein VK939_18505, partial [Longimicrobiales bacterium]|nr:hypothetical protein [Longimicrobiales bacterium]
MRAPLATPPRPVGAVPRRRAGLRARFLLPALFHACLPGCERGAAPETPRIGGTAVIAGYVELRTMNPLYTLPDVNKALERYA